jgi:hypothetical protein
MTESTDYQYRVFGATAQGYRVTEWKDDRGEAVYIYGECGWPWITFQRREAGDDATIQQKPKPSDDDWTDVTADMIHPADDEIPEAPEA